MQISVLKAIVIDDETPAREILKGLLDLHKSVKVVGESDNVQDGILQIIEHKPKIVFLDVEMPDKNGLDLMDSLKKLQINPIIILTTAFPNFAIDAFDRAAFGYLVKPIDPEKLTNYINRALCNIHQKNSRSKLKFSVLKGYIVVDPSELLCAKADGNYTHLHLVDGTVHTITLQLGKLLPMLPQPCFFRVSRSAIVNSQFVKFLDRQYFQCNIQADKIKIEVPISKEGLNLLKDFI